MTSEPISVRALDLAVAAEVRAEIARNKDINVSILARRLGMRRATLTDRTQGRRPFHPSLLDAVAAELGMRASEITARAEQAVGSNARTPASVA